MDFKTTKHWPRPYLTLLAVERKSFDKRPLDVPLDKWLFEPNQPGVQWVRLDPPEATVATAVKEIPLTTYRVALADGKFAAERQKDAPMVPISLWPTWMFGMFLSLSFVSLGMWVVRRPGRRTGL
jgi:hypothetical protein